MIAARLYEIGKPLAVEDVKEPEIRPGGVIVRVEAAFVAPSSADVVEGRLPFTLPPLPFTPGMDTIGVVEDAADDVTGIVKGQRVYCDHFYASRTAGAPPDACFIGYFGFTPASTGLLSRWRDGSFAQKLLIPAECVTPLNEAGSMDAALLCRLGYLGTGYGGIVRGGFRPGQSLIVNGATGVLGVGAVLLGLAMGASRIICVGRKEEVLERLKNLDPKRVISVQRRGDGADARRIASAAGGADVMVDTLGYVDDPAPTVDAMAALRPGGTAVLVGGVSATVPVSYRMLLGMELTVRGSAWFPRSAAGEIVRMISAGTLDLSALRPHAFALDKVDEAIRSASARPGGFDHVALVP